MIGFWDELSDLTKHIRRNTHELHVTPNSLSKKFGRGMAYLPGERPLINPWDQSSPFLKGSQTSSGGIVNILVGVAGAGSVYIESGSGVELTKMIVSVRGPRQQPVNRSVFDVETSYASFAFPPVGGARDLSKELSAFVKEAIEGSICLDLYPQSAVTVHIKILQGGYNIHATLPAAVIGSSIACENTGLQLRDRVLAVSLGINGPGEFELNASDSTLNKKACATIAMLVKSRSLSLIHITGGSIEGGVDSIDPLVDAAERAISDLSTSLAARFSI